MNYESKNTVLNAIRDLHFSIKRSWNHLTPTQRDALVAVVQTAQVLNVDFVKKNIAKIRRQKCV